MEKSELTRLVQRAQRGEMDAFDALVRRFQNPAVLYARSLLHFDRAAAEDAAQEAFVQAWRDLPSLAVPAAFPAWLRRIVFKYCDRVRRRGQLCLVPLDTAFYVGGGVEPACVIEAGEDAAALRRALEALPDRERPAALLYYRDDHDLAEIASFLGVPRTTVKNRLHAARQRLRKELWEMAEEILEREKPSHSDAFSQGVVTRILEEFRRQMRADPHTADRKLLVHGRNALEADLMRPDPLNWETVRAGFDILERQDERRQIVALLMRCLAQPLDESQTAWAYLELIGHAAWDGNAAAAVLAFEAFERWLPGKHPRLGRDSHSPVIDTSEAFYQSEDEMRMLALGRSGEFARSWRDVWREKDYLARVDDLLGRVTPTDTNRQLRFSMLRMSCMMCETRGTADGFEQARGYIRHMYALANEPQDASEQAHWRAKALNHDMVLCSRAKRMPEAMEKAQQIADLLATAHGDWVRGERHNLGCQLPRQNRFDLALSLFEQNLAEGGHVNAWGWLMHAAVLWQQTGDRRRTLELIRAGAVRGSTDMTRDFQNLPEFADVKDDPEFQAAVRRPE